MASRKRGKDRARVYTLSTFLRGIEASVSVQVGPNVLEKWEESEGKEGGKKVGLVGLTRSLSLW